MKKNYEYLNDISFLKNVSNLHLKTVYAKITILDWQEREVEEVETKIINGDINIDGKSSLRRTANLTVLLDKDINKITNVKNLFSINKKIDLEIGYVNTTNEYLKYPILWFPLGLYVITSASLTRSLSAYTISLQLRDKMCLLNGDCGGVIPASTIFDNYDTVDENGEWVNIRPTIYQIIRELVNHFGGEQLGKIIISDLDLKVKQAVKWIGNSQLFFLNHTEKGYYLTISEKQAEEKISNENYYNIEGSPYSYGMDVGYIYTDFTYPGDLICEPGATITSILDQIIQVLGNYEYFYNLNGDFVFQEKKNYLNNSQSKYILDSLNNRKLVPDYIADNQAYMLDIRKDKSVFIFNDDNFLISCTNNPQYNSIKNDFVVWGERQTTDGQTIPIRYHLVIDKKPLIGNTYEVFEFQDPDYTLSQWHCPIKYDSINDFPTKGAAGVFYMDTSSNIIFKWSPISENNEIKEYGYIPTTATLESITTTDWRTELYFQGVVSEPYGTESNYYYTELRNEWPKIYDVRKGQFFEQVINNPTGIDYYLDFIDTQTSLAELSIDSIGRRSLVINNSQSGTNCIFESWIPDIVFISKEYSKIQSVTIEQAKQECEKRGQDFCEIGDDIFEFLSVGGFLNSAYEEIRQQLHENVSYNENITLQTLPLYFLEPNTRITVNDLSSDIYGDYLISTLSFSIGIDSVLTINALRVLQRV